MRTHPALRSWFLSTIPHERNEGSRVKWLILGRGQRNYEVSPEHVAVSDRKCLKKKNKKRQVGDMSRGRRNQPERAPSGRSWDSVSHTVNIIVLARNPSTIK